MKQKKQERILEYEICFFYLIFLKSIKCENESVVGVSVTTVFTMPISEPLNINASLLHPSLFIEMESVTFVEVPRFH